MMNLNVFTRILLIALLPALLVTLVLSMYFVLARATQVEELELRALHLIGDNLAKAGEYGVAIGNDEVLSNVARSALSIESIRSIRFTTLSDENLVAFDAQAGNTQPIGLLGRIARPWLTDRKLVEEVRFPVVRTDLVNIFDPLIDEPATVGNDRSHDVIGNLYLRIDLSNIWHLQEAVIMRGLTITGIALLSVLIGATLLARAISRPIRKVTSSIRQLAYQRYPDPLREDLAGELGELNRGVNYLSQELQSIHTKLRESTRIATKDLHTALRVLEKQNLDLREERQKAESASQFKSDFLANISHEIRTPMNSIVGWVSILRQSRLSEEQRGQLALINSSAQDLLHLIHDVLDISKIESGTADLDPIDTDLEQVLQDINQSLAQRAANRNIELFVSSIPDHRYRQVSCDQMRLKQVLLNLLNNAIKFTHLGHVLLDVNILHVDEDQATFRFLVQDTGIGIPQEKLELLFEAFRQVDMSTTRKYGGAGLGLHITRQIVRMMNGHIEVSSAVGRGTRIGVTITFSLLAKSAERRLHKLPAIQYIDAYEALEQQNRQQLELAGARLVAADQVDHSAILLLNIPNQNIGSDWQALLPSGIDSWQHRYVLVSQISTTLRSEIQRAGFSGYVVRSPHIALYNESICSMLKYHAEGTAFEQAVPSVRPEEAPEPDDFSDLNLLTVDDNSLNLDLMSYYMNHLKVSAVAISDSDEALALLQQEPFDLVILDLYLPGKDGFEIVREIRSASGPNQDTTIVALTADAFSATRDKAIDNGFDLLLTKPVTIEQISQLLRHFQLGTLNSMDFDKSRFEHASQNPIPTRPDSGDSEETPSIEDGNLAVLQHERLVSVEAIAASVIDDRAWIVNALATYAGDVEEFKRDLIEHVLQQDRTGLHQSIHSIKGVSDLCRIHRVAEGCRLIEQLLPEADWEVIGTRVDELINLLDIVAMQCHTIVDEERMASE